MTRRARVLVTACALAAAVPQWLQYFGHVRRGDYPGSAYAPRVAAVLKASRTALQGGPFATVPAEGGYSVAPGLLNDLGFAAIVDLSSRATGRRATQATLGGLNLALLVAACLGLVLAFPAVLRLALVPVFLMVPLIVPLYRNVDSVAVHGALAALATVAVLATLRVRHVASALAGGVLLFLVHKLRSPFAVYAMLPLCAGAALAWLALRDPGPARRVGWLLLAFAACEVPWRVAVHSRLSDPRLVEKDALPAHNFYEPLISGIGWTPNPWGIQPSDPWVATYLAERVGGDPVAVETPESERRAQIVYFSLVQERPLDLAWLYLRRIPYALGQYSVLGAWGAALWLPASGLALLLTLSRKDLDGFATIAACGGMACGLVAQVVLIDTRYIYANPLGLVSALALAASGGIVFQHPIAWRLWRLGRVPSSVSRGEGFPANP